MFNPNVNFILNSNNQIFKFELTDDKKIIYTIYDFLLNPLESSTLNDANILKYAVLIDENECIHLAVLLSTGELNYHKYESNMWSKATIAKFDLRSNLYNQIELLMINKKLNVLFNYSNLINSNIWTIQHVIYGTNEKHNAIRYITKKIPDPFSIDFDSQGTIHLFYRTFANNISQIYHGFYSPFIKSWNSLTKQISRDDTNNLYPFLFIDKMDNLHGIWLEESNEKFELKYMKMNSKGKERYIWKEINLPYISVSKYQPIIFEEDNILKIQFRLNNSIVFLKSTDYGNSFTKDTEFKVSDDLALIRVQSSLESYKNKIKFGYCDLSYNPKPYFFETYLEKAIKEKTKESIINLDENINIVKISQKLEPNQKIQNLEDTMKKLDEILENQVNINIILKDIIRNHEIFSVELENIKNLLGENKFSIFKRFFG